MPPTSRDTRISGAVSSVYEDRDGNIWVGTSKGIERLRDGVFTTYSTAEGLPSDAMGPVYVDGARRTWFAPADGGLFWMRDGHVERVDLAGLSDDVVYSIAGGGDDVWVGRQRGGLTRISPQGDGFIAEQLTQADGLAQNSVYAVHEARDGAVWAGTLEWRRQPLQERGLHHVQHRQRSVVEHGVVDSRNHRRHHVVRHAERRIHAVARRLAPLPRTRRPAIE